MKKFRVRVPFQGYCRGTTTCVIEAVDMEGALGKFETYSGEEDIIRDDREFNFEDADVTEVEE